MNQTTENLNPTIILIDDSGVDGGIVNNTVEQPKSGEGLQAIIHSNVVATPEPSVTDEDDEIELSIMTDDDEKEMLNSRLVRIQPSLAPTVKTTNTMLVVEDSLEMEEAEVEEELRTTIGSIDQPNLSRRQRQAQNKERLRSKHQARGGKKKRYQVKNLKQISTQVLGEAKRCQPKVGTIKQPSDSKQSPSPCGVSITSESTDTNSSDFGSIAESDSWYSDYSSNDGDDFEAPEPRPEDDIPGPSSNTSGTTPKYRPGLEHSFHTVAQYFFRKSVRACAVILATVLPTIATCIPSYEFVASTVKKSVTYLNYGENFKCDQEFFDKIMEKWGYIFPTAQAPPVVRWVEVVGETWDTTTVVYHMTTPVVKQTKEVLERVVKAVPVYGTPWNTIFFSTLLCYFAYKTYNWKTTFRFLKGDDDAAPPCAFMPKQYTIYEHEGKQIYKLQSAYYTTEDRRTDNSQRTVLKHSDPLISNGLVQTFIKKIGPGWLNEKLMSWMKIRHKTMNVKIVPYVRFKYSHELLAQINMPLITKIEYSDPERWAKINFALQGSMYPINIDRFDDLKLNYHDFTAMVAFILCKSIQVKMQNLPFPKVPTPQSERK
jgi:hypothetical protein